MKYTIVLLLSLFLIVGCTEQKKEETGSTEEKGHANWLTDFDAGLAKAKETNKKVLVDFTGSDWCVWCIKLDDEVFSKKKFTDFADKNLVLVELDFPRKKAQDPEVRKKNQALLEKYKVEGFPTVLILDGDGKILKRTGYKKGGPDAYITHLQDVVK